MPRIKPRTKLYRNFDQEFERILSRKSAERKIAVNILLADNNFGFSLTLTDEDAIKNLQRTLDLLDEDDDVTDVWTNWNE